MNSSTNAGKRHIVTIENDPLLGSNWIVRTYRRALLRKKLISSDWFLGKEQAERFAEQLVADLAANGSPSLVQERKPGWTLQRVPR